MDTEKTMIPMNPFSEYALLVEDDDYPKPEIVILQLRGKVDPAAFAQAYSESVKLVPLFQCHLVEKKKGFFYVPYWVPNTEVENRLIVEDCRHLAADPFEVTDFSDMYFAERTRRRIDLHREFPFRAHLIHVGEDLHLLALVFHHSAMDPFKGYTVMTHTLERYHEMVTGKKPAWSGSAGSLASARSNKALVKPLPMLTFAREQLTDVWYTNRASILSKIACEKILDYHEVKGRHCLRTRITDMQLIKTLVDRAVSIDCTFNDVLMAVARQTLSEWNADHGKAHDRFRMMLATSLVGRADLPMDAGAGLGGLNFVSAGHENADLDTLIRFFGECRRTQLKRGVDVSFYKTLDRLVGALRVLPLKTRTNLIRPTIERIPCTLSLSNTGSIWPKSVDELGRQSLESKIVGAGDFRIDVWHTNVSIARNLGIGLTCRTHNKIFYLDFVYDRFRFRRHEAEALTERLVKNIHGAA